MTFGGFIDAHVHLWDKMREDDILILEKEPMLAPMGQAGALQSFLHRSRSVGAIVVQSAPSKPHSDWLRSASRSVDGIVGIVGWIDPLGSNFEADLTDLTREPLVCGVRVMLNRMQCPGNILKKKAIDNLAALADAGLTIECLAPMHLLAHVEALAKALPTARIVLDHCGLPSAEASEMAEWESRLFEISRHGNVSTKLSGLIEPFGVAAEPGPVQERALKAIGMFGPARVMAASNFPVVALGGGAEIWADMLENVLHNARLSPQEHQLIIRGAALSAYPRIPQQVPECR